MRITEIHSSDMSTACMKKIELRRKGLVKGSSSTALVKGSLADACLCHVHTDGRWTPDAVEAAMDAAEKEVGAKFKEERRPPTQAVRDNWSTIRKEVLDRCQHYADRMADWFLAGELIGVQVPVNYQFDKYQFVSTLDLLYRNEEGTLTVADWKYQKDGPDFAYLSRNHQMGAYHLCIKYGSCLVDGEWVQYGEHPRLEWYDLARFTEYKRAHKTFKAGDQRPLDSIRKWWYTSDDKENLIRQQIALKWTMIENDVFVTHPEKVVCDNCESAMWCDNYHADF